MPRGRCEACSRRRTAISETEPRPRGKQRYIPERDNLRQQTLEWRKLAKAFRAKYPLCESCKTVGVYEPAHSVDHILGWWMFPDLRFDEGNLQSLCRKCHQGEKRQREGIGEFIDYRRRVVIRLSEEEFAEAKERGRRLREMRRQAIAPAR